MLKRILLPVPAQTDDERASRVLWEKFITAIEADGVETHPADCACKSPGCARLRLFRKYHTVSLRVRRHRYQIKQLQAQLDEFVSENNEQMILNAHEEALAEQQEPS